jgi:transcriptional regulator with XRE-family HTH domain
MPDADATHNRLRQHLADTGISERELARRLGWTQARLQRRMVGDVELTITELTEIAETLGVPATRFLPEQVAP